MRKNGIFCEINDKCIYLDPKNTGLAKTNFVSHAHFDHLPSKNHGTVLCSDETHQIAELRGVNMDHTDSLENYTLIDSGHILGSKGLLFDDIFYTGDICTRDRGFLHAAKIPECKTLIIESTFGLPEFIFPKIEDTIKKVNKLIASLYSKGVPVILMGYQLGKAQTLTQLFGHWAPLYFHDSVKQMNQLHQKLGITLSDGIGHTEALKNGLLEKKPWIMIAPILSAKSDFLKEMKKYGAVTIGFSGWAKSTKHSFGRRTDYTFPLSDHCDFAELVDVVQRSKATKVYTTHGFVTEFAQYLNKKFSNKEFHASPLLASSLIA